MGDEIKANFKVKRKHLLRNNPWVVATIVLGILVVLLLAGNISGITGKTISGSKAAENLVNFAVSQGVSAEFSSVKSESSFYLVNILIEGEEYPYYVTKDGKYLISPNYLVPLTEEEGTEATAPVEETPTEVPKSAKPVVELFIWGYCPYGVQAQGPLAEVAVLLENYADFKAVMYYDGHGEYETEQNMIQECIQELYPTKYWDYAAGFVTDVYTACSSVRTVDCDKTESTKLMKSSGIDSTKVFKCVDEKGEELVSEAFNYAKSLGVTGSPTLVINGVVVNVARNAESYKSAVCSAFIDAPEECGTALNSESGSSSGSC